MPALRLIGFGTVASGLDLPEADLGPVVRILERQRADGWHQAAQCYVSLRGVPVLDVGVGEARPGRPVRPDDLMLWYSSGKPLTTVAVLQLWEQGRLGLDDLVADYIDGWGNGKERCTLRHVLTHTGGFPMYRDTSFDEDISYEEAIRRIAAHRADWEPGTAAAYHPVTGWKVLGAIVEAVDGRPIDRYVREEVTAPLGLVDTHLGIPVDEQPALADRLVPVTWTGHMFPVIDRDGALSMRPYRIDAIHNEPWHIAKVEPGGGARGPARELGRLYESFLGYGPVDVLEPRTVELMVAVHRWGMHDPILGPTGPFGLGFAVEFSGGVGRRAFGHTGMASSRGVADPDCGLVLVVVCNGLPNPIVAERRVYEVTDAIYRALGELTGPYRRETTPARPATPVT